MNHYETLFIVQPEVAEPQRKETVERIKRLIEGMGGRDFVAEEWGLRDLAYLIRKQSKGFYVRLEYVSRPDVVKELERTMKLADEILRFVSVRVPKVRKTSAAAPAPASTPSAPETAPAE